MRPARSVRPVRHVQHAAARLELARVHAEVGELADERVGHDLERERGERSVVLRLAHGRGVLLLALLRRLEALDRRDVERARQVVEDRVEQRLHALVLEARAAEDGRERGALAAVEVERGLADVGLQAVHLDVLALEVVLHQLVVVLGDGLDQRGAAGLGGLLVLGRDVGLLPLLAEVVLVDDGLHGDEVDDPAEVRLSADRQLDRDRDGAEAVDHRLDALVEVRSDAVHLVDVGDPRDAVLVGLAPDRLGLRLDAGYGVEEGDRAVEHAQRALDLDGEVDVARRVDDVDPVVLPGRRGRGRRDRDAALLLLLHPVHDRSALVDLAHLVGPPRVVEDALGRRGLTGIDVSHDADVACLL